MTVAAKKPGFGGQWIEIFSTGTHTDDAGNQHNIDAAFLDAVAGNLNVTLHEPPAVIGHPETDAPAYGWVCAARRNADKLEVQLCDTDPQFEEMVRTGKFKKRSASFYLDKDKAPGGIVPQLRHVGHLGARPPAVKGLRDVQFKEGEAITFEFSEGEDMDQKELEKTIGERVTAFLKEKFGIGKDDHAAPAFSEADAKAMVDAALKPLTDEITALKTENTSLKGQLSGLSGNSRKAEIVAFCDSLPGTILPAMKRAGIVEFMEALAAGIPAESKVAVVSFDEQGAEKKVDGSALDWFKGFLKSLPPFIQFGEQFGKLQAKGDGSELSNEQDRNVLRAAMNVKKSDAGAAK